MNDFTQFERDLLMLAANFEKGKETKAFLKKQGRKLNKKQREKVSSLTNKKTGNLSKAQNFKTGKVYKYHSDDLSVRAYSKSQHAHLLDKGHRKVSKTGQELGFTPGVNFMEKAQREFEDENYNDTQDFIEKMLKKGLS